MFADISDLVEGFGVQLAEICPKARRFTEMIQKDVLSYRV